MAMAQEVVDGAMLKVAGVGNPLQRKVSKFFTHCCSCIHHSAVLVTLYRCYLQ